MNDTDNQELKKILTQAGAIENIDQILEQLKNQTDLKAIRQELSDLQKSINVYKHEVTQVDQTLSTVTELQIAQNQELLSQRETISKLVDVLLKSKSDRFSLSSFAAGSVAGGLSTFIILSLIIYSKLNS